MLLEFSQTYRICISDICCRLFTNRFHIFKKLKQRIFSLNFDTLTENENTVYILSPSTSKKGDNSGSLW